MSRVIQLISHNQHLFALTDAGEIFATPSVLNAKWSLFEGPQLASQSYCQASASGESFAPHGQRESTFNQVNCVAPQAHNHQFLGIPILSPEDWMKPHSVVKRRPTSIGSDGNYLPPLGD